MADSEPTPAAAPTPPPPRPQWLDPFMNDLAVHIKGTQGWPGNDSRSLDKVPATAALELLRWFGVLPGSPAAPAVAAPPALTEMRAELDVVNNILRSLTGGTQGGGGKGMWPVIGMLFGAMAGGGIVGIGLSIARLVGGDVTVVPMLIAMAVPLIIGIVGMFASNKAMKG